MEQDRISTRQLYAMLFTGLLTPAVRVLPGLTAAVATIYLETGAPSTYGLKPIKVDMAGAVG